MAKKIKFGFKMPYEDIREAIESYIMCNGDFLDTRKDVLNEIKLAKENGIISKHARPKIFKITVELE